MKKIKLTTEEFIKRAKEVHGDKYDYSKVNYVNRKAKIIIICPIHGEFLQSPGNHLSGAGCPECGRIRTINSRRLTTEEFIKRAREIHGDKYDYSKVNYINSITPVTIICPVHGEFKQRPDNHIFGKTGCPYCNGGMKYTQEEFIKRAKEVHGDKYDYSKVNYIDSITPVTIICPIHGEFEQKPVYHLSGNGCSMCSGTKKLTNEEFIERAKGILGDGFGFEKTNYIDINTPVIITCPIHGDIQKIPHHILSLHSGCPYCNGRVKITQEEFIKRAKEVHGDKYDYSKVNYVNSNTPVTIICPIHGEFEQIPSVHLSNHGCPMCNSSRLETTIRVFLQNHNIKFEEQKTWDWLRYIQPQYVDFYLPTFNVVIECQGLQHFIKSDLFDRSEELETRTDRDINKQKLCLENGILIYYFSNLSTNIKKFEYPYLVFEDPDLLLDTIKTTKLLLPY